MMLHRMALAFIVSFFLPMYPSSVSAQSEVSLYKGKTVRIIVGYSPGGGYDANARLLARFLGTHIPGNPNVVVENMPGASSLKSVQYLEEAPKDGTVITAFSAGLVIQSQIDPANFPIRLMNYSWIGSIGQEVRVCFMRAATGVKTFDQLKKLPLISFGETGTGSAGYIDQSIMRTMLGVNVKTILGYPGSADKMLAVERGELDGDCISFTSIPVDWIKNNKINVIYRSSTPLLPGIPATAPYILDLVHNPEQVRLIKLLLAPTVVGRPYIASKDIPKDRLAILTQAFAATLKDPDFVAAAGAANLAMVGPMTGDEAAAYIADSYSVGPDIIAGAKKITGGQ
jgi:tripartite-type tricarboxylate transporter receptor subunit TctC